MSLIVIFVACVIWLVVGIVLDVIKETKTIHGTMEIGDQDLGTETPIYNVNMGSLSQISKKKYIVLDIKKISAPPEPLKTEEDVL